MTLRHTARAMLVVSLATGCADAAPGIGEFDPGTVNVGDSVAGLEIVHMDVQRVFGDSAWSGDVTFRGPMTLDGVYQRHFDFPEPNLVCFHVAAHAVDRVPRFVPDAFSSPGMKTWFCFSNQEHARGLLGDGGTPREARIVVDDYTLVRHFSDVFSTARLVEVVRTGAPARNTLRDTAQSPVTSL